jgi:opacity protein-like surface antigen
MRMGRRTVLAALACLVALPAVASAGGDHFEKREWGVRVGGGVAPTTLIQYYAIHPYLGLAVWDPASLWFEQYGVHALWMIEPWVAYVNDDHAPHKTDSFELGLNAIFFRFVFGSAAWRPFIEAGEGAVYTDLRKQDLGSRLQFTSTVGVGLEYEIRPDLAIGLQGRFRHMSNAGMATSNPGINTAFGLIGLTFR